MKTLVIASNCSGGGKTTVTLGLMKALINRGYSIQGFKSGPDYIDTAFHTRITGRPSRNLDLFMEERDGVIEVFNRGEGDLAIVEGAMGLYDGKGVTEEYSTYHVAKTLNNAPILLVVTPKAQSLTLLAELKGIKDFKNANIVGVILNKVSKSYFTLLKEIIEKNSNLKVFGYIEKNEKISLNSRHLGLVQSDEIVKLEEKIETLANIIEKTVDLDLLIKEFKDVTFKKEDKFKMENKGLKIGVARDKAFSFYYKENLEILESLGKVEYFSPIGDKNIPEDLDFIYIGGGYPEVFKEALAKNTSMKKSILKALEGGTPCYAECGGLMYLTEEIEGFKMVGFFKGKSEMTSRLNNFGYATLKFKDIRINCQEFHKSITKTDMEKVYTIEKIGYMGQLKTWHCGYERNNTLAGYPHVHFFSNLKFLEYILTDRKNNKE